MTDPGAVAMGLVVGFALVHAATDYALRETPLGTKALGWALRQQVRKIIREQQPRARILFSGEIAERGDTIDIGQVAVIIPKEASE